MIYRKLFLMMATLMISTASIADTFTSLGTRWPAGLKKTISSTSNHLFSASGDLLVAYDNDSNMAVLDQLPVDAPEGILAIRSLGSAGVLAAACGSGGLKVFEFETSDPNNKHLVEKASLSTSTVQKGGTTGTVDLNITSCTVFKTGSTTTMIAASDESYGLRIFKYTPSASTDRLTEVSQLELEEADTIVALDTWLAPSGQDDLVLGISKNRYLKVYKIIESLGGTGFYNTPQLLEKAELPLPDGTPSSPLYAFNLFAMTLQGSHAYIIENTLGNIYLFDINGSGPYLNKVYPISGEDPLTFAYPIDLAAGTGHLYVSTLVKHSNGKMPGIQVVDLSDPSAINIVKTVEKKGMGGLHLDATNNKLFAFDMKEGISRLDTTTPTSLTPSGTPKKTPFSIARLNAFQNYLLAADGLDSAKGGFRILDITNPTLPKREILVKTPGEATFSAVTDDIYRLFVADGAHGVNCYSMNSSLVEEGKTSNDYGGTGQPPIPSPLAPLLIGNISKANLDNSNAVDVAVTVKTIGGTTSRFLHVLTANGQFFSVPLPLDPTSETLLDPTIDLTKMVKLSLSGTPKRILAFKKDYILVAGGSAGLLVVDLFSDISSPDDLHPGVKTQFTDGLTNTFCVTSDNTRFAFIIDETAKIVSFDLFNNSNTPNTIALKKLGAYAPANDEITVSYVDIFASATQTLYAISDEPGYELQLLNISDPSKIMETSDTKNSTHSTAGTPMSIVATVSSPTPGDSALRAAFVADGQGGIAVRQTAEGNNSQEQVWNDDEDSCFINTLGL